MPPKSDYQYIKVQDDTDPEERSVPNNKGGTFSLLSVLFIGLATAIATSLITFLALHIVANPPKTPAKLPQQFKHHCGNSSTEAKDLGCTFDPLAVAWLPKDCPRDMAQEFVDAAEPSWEYWMDKEKTMLYPDLETLSVGTDYYARNGEHYSHCAYMILRLYSVLERGGSADSTAMSFNHTHHCFMWILDSLKSEPELWDKIGTTGKIDYLSC